MKTPSATAANDTLAGLFEDRETATRAPDTHLFVTWTVRPGRAPGEGA